MLGAGAHEGVEHAAGGNMDAVEACGQLERVGDAGGGSVSLIDTGRPPSGVMLRLGERAGAIAASGDNADGHDIQADSAQLCSGGPEGGVIVRCMRCQV